MVGHHLEEMVRLGADLAGDVHLNLVDVVLQPLLHQPGPALHLPSLLLLHLEGIGPVGLAQGLSQEGEDGVEGGRVGEIKVLVEENTGNV